MENDYGCCYTLDEIEEMRKKQCKYCGEDGLSWVETDRGWRLQKDGVVHECWSKNLVPPPRRRENNG